MIDFPIYMTVRDYGSPVPPAVDFLLDCTPPLGFNRVTLTIVDVASTFPPLLEWYDRIAPKIDCLTIQRWPDNEHHHRTAFQFAPGGPLNLLPSTHNPLSLIQYREAYFALTDGDLDYSECGSDLLEDCFNVLQENKEICKAGVSLATHDLPGENPHRNEIILHERGYWIHNLHDDLNVPWYKAPIDTAFAVYKRHSCTYGPAVRSAKHVAKHLPWYFHGIENWTADYRYFIEHCEPQHEILWSARDKDLWYKSQEPPKQEWWQE